MSTPNLNKAKKPLAFSLIVCSIVCVAFLVCSMLVDYNKLRDEAATILQQICGVSVQVSKIEVNRLPLPSVIFHDLSVSDVLSAGKVEVVCDLMSVLKLAPKIQTIIIRADNYVLEVTPVAENGQYKYSKGRLSIPDMTTLIAHYPDLAYAAHVVAPNSSIAAEFDIVTSRSAFTFTNMQIKCMNNKFAGEVVINTTGDKSASFKITSDKVYAAEELSNFSALGSFEKDSIRINSMSAVVGADGYILVSGAVTNNGYRSVFNGEMKLSYPDANSVLNKIGLGAFATDVVSPVNMSANIVVNPIEFAMQNIVATVGDLATTGDSAVIFIGDTPRIHTTMQLKHFDSAKRYPVLSRIVDYAVSLTQNMMDKEYLAKFAAISDMKYISHFDLTLLDSKFNDFAVDSLSVSGYAASHQVNFSDFKYKNANNNFYGTASLTTNGMRPELKVNVDGGKWSGSRFDLKNIVASLLYLKKNCDFSKMKIGLDVVLDEIDQEEGAKFTNPVFAATFDDKSISDVSMHSTIDQSHIDINGNITLGEPMMANIAFGYNIGHIDALTRLISSNLSMSGMISTRGMLSTHFNTPEELFYNAYVKAELIADKLTVAGYNVEDFVQQISLLTYNPITFESDIDAITNTNTSSVIDHISSKYEVDNGVLSISDLSFHTPSSSSAATAVYNAYTGDYKLSSVTSFTVPITKNNKQGANLTFTFEKNGQNAIFDVDSRAIVKALNARAR